MWGNFMFLPCSKKKSSRLVPVVIVVDYSISQILIQTFSLDSLPRLHEENSTSPFQPSVLRVEKFGDTPGEMRKISIKESVMLLEKILYLSTHQMLLVQYMRESIGTRISGTLICMQKILIFRERFSKCGENSKNKYQSQVDLLRRIWRTQIIQTSVGI